jgi:hypothetical protein
MAALDEIHGLDQQDPARAVLNQRPRCCVRPV